MQKYYNTSGREQHPLDILKYSGVNYIRLRLWVNAPDNGYNGLDKVLSFVPLIKARGFKLLIGG